MLWISCTATLQFTISIKGVTASVNIDVMLALLDKFGFLIFVSLHSRKGYTISGMTSHFLMLLCFLRWFYLQLYHFQTVWPDQADLSSGCQILYCFHDWYDLLWKFLRWSLNRLILQVYIYLSVQVFYYDVFISSAINSQTTVLFDLILYRSCNSVDMF